MKTPSKEALFVYEEELYSQGIEFVAGIDEAGRGPLAGPVVSACVVFPARFFIEGVYDSKALSARRREELYGLILEGCLDYAVGVVDNLTIDRINIYQAAKLSMLQALESLTKVEPLHVLTDAMPLGDEVSHTAIVKGDQKSFTIAAASIIAKVTRDRMMDELHAECPGYGWDRNRGYPTAEHREAVKRLGFTKYHRRTFAVK